ncbi:MAG: penicillin-binding protein 2 [Planctomycetes bacterium]|nr:penicillin-binding protein 2 [Planctomycetota bacterium]
MKWSMQSWRRGTRTPGLETAPTAGQRCQLTLAAAALTLLFGVLAYRLFTLQVLNHPYYRSRVESMLNRGGLELSWGRRGDVRLACGTIVARETVRYILAIDPTRLSPEKQAQVLEAVCRQLDIPEVERRKKSQRLELAVNPGEAGERRPLRYLPLGRGIPEDQAMAVKQLLSKLLTKEEMGSFCLEPLHYREYPRGPFLGTVVGATQLGKTARDLAGAAGLELSLDAFLAGWDGHRKVICDGLRTTRLFRNENVDIPPVDGFDAILTIDARIQGIAEEELQRGMDKEKAAGGMAVIMHSKTGNLLAMASLPAFDPSHFHHYPKDELDRRRRNRIIESQYEPGSTIKPFIAAVALEKGIFRPDQIIWAGGKEAVFLGRPVSDVSNHGPITFEEAVIYSSNIGMTVVGLKLGGEGLIETLERFRFQKQTGMPLPGEATGWRTPRKKWSERYSTISVSFGFELSMTAIQLLSAYNSLVNGGHYYRPRLVERLERGHEVYRMPVEELGQPIKPETSQAMRDILHQVIERGTAKGWKIPGLPYGGKTGTAALSNGKSGYHRDGRKAFLSSLVAFAPYPDPEIVLLVMLEKPQTQHFGSSVCGPIVTSILRRIFRVPDEETKIAAKVKKDGGNSSGVKVSWKELAGRQKAAGSVNGAATGSKNGRF